MSTDAVTIPRETMIPASVRANYSQIARDASAATGRSAKGCMAEMAKDFASRHKDAPAAGWDYLAAWAKGHDPATDEGPSTLEAAQARAVESAKRDPLNALANADAVVAVAVATVTAQDAAAAAGPDAASGIVPNPGPVSVEGGASSTS